MQPGAGGGVLSGCGPADQPGDHEPFCGAAGLSGPGHRGVEGALPAASSKPQRQRAVDPSLHGQRRGGARGVGPSSHPAAHGGHTHGVPIVASSPRRQRVRSNYSTYHKNGSEQQNRRLVLN